MDISKEQSTARKKNPKQEEGENRLMQQGLLWEHLSLTEEQIGSPGNRSPEGGTGQEAGKRTGREQRR